MFGRFSALQRILIIFAFCYRILWTGNSVLNMIKSTEFPVWDNYRFVVRCHEVLPRGASLIKVDIVIISSLIDV